MSDEIHLHVRMTFSHARITAKTLAISLLGLLVARLLSFPIPELTGPAMAISLVGLCGVSLGLPNLLRDVAFILLGLSIGAGMSAEVTQMLLDLPMAFAALTASTVLGLWLSRKALIHHFGYDRQSALLAASPGHLSFVLSMGAQYNLNLQRITIVQSIRLLSLTLLTPLLTASFGLSEPTSLAPQGPVMAPWTIAALATAAVIFSRLLTRLKVPAPLLIGAMILSMVGHGSGTTPGQMPLWLALPAFVILGTLIGTRFGSVTFAELRAAAWAGCLATLICAATAFVFALGVAFTMGMPPEALMIAFAPGGLETMVAMSVALGVSPGFVAACHLGRLLVLSALVQVLFSRTLKR